MSLYDLLTDEEKKDVKVVSYKKGNIIFHENDQCEYIGFVLKGTVTITSYSFKGTELNYNILDEGGVFGNYLLFSTDNAYRGNVIAKTNATVGLLNKEKTLQILQNNRNFLLKFLEYDSDFSKQLNARVKLLSFDGAEERFMYYLFMHQGKITYSSITKLADELVLQRETLSRLITRLTNEKVIKRVNKTIIRID